MYFIYDQILKNDRRKSRNQCLSHKSFDYSGYWKYLRQTLNVFKKECSSVLVVFDGVFKRNANRRPDPERTSGICFSGFNVDQNQLPSLFRDAFIDSLRDLNIEVIVARGEADPMIVRLAQDRNAYIVAADTDYHLHDLPRGYTPLKFLDLRRLQGILYRMNDVFEGVDAKGVALWASFIKYDYVSLVDLQVRTPAGESN